MKKLLLLSALAVVLVVPAQALAANITVSTTGFTPASLTINQGDTVTWTNPDTATHQVTSRKAGFSSPVLSTGQTFSFVFKTAGSFSIQETLDKKLKGTVVVQATRRQRQARRSLSSRRRPPSSTAAQSRSRARSRASRAA